MRQRRVVITGLGVASGLGIGADPFWEGLLEGRSAIGPVRSFDASEFPVRLASEVGEFKMRDFVPKSYRKAAKVMCRDIELAVAAALRAVEDAGLRTKCNIENGNEAPTYAPERVGCQIGAGLVVADIDEISAAFATAQDDPQNPESFNLKNWGERGLHNLTPLWLLKFLPNMLACHVTIVHDCRGPSNTITCNEVSGGLCIGEARRVIERGDAELCFAGGAESKINPLGMLRQSFIEMMAETGEDVDPASVIQPYGTNAPGSLPGEGASIVMVEEYESAKGRHTPIYAEIVGFGAGQAVDLCSGHITPNAKGEGLRSAIEQALRDARIEAEAIDAIVPLGAGTSAYDTAEANALRGVFGDRLKEIPLVTTKPNVGMCAAAAGAIDLAAGALCLRHQTLPARMNGENVMDGLDAKTIGQRDAQLDHVLICATGLGGQSTAVVLKKM